MTKSIIATIAVMLTIIMSATGAYAARSAISEKTASDSEFFVPVYAENNKDITLGTWDFTEDAAEETENTDADETTTEASNEIEPDFKRLEEVFPFYNFDRSSKTASDEALYNLIWEFGSARKYINENDVESVFESTTIHGVNFAIGYIRYSADKVDNLMKTLYKTEPNHKEKNTINGYTYCVYDGNYYYLNIEIMGWYDFPKVKNWKLNSDGTYTISVKVAEGDCEGEMYTIKAKPIMFNGKSDWAIYSVKRNDSDSKIDYLSTDTISTYTWQNAYKDYLNSKLSEKNDDACFSLAYIDDDDVPELIYSQESIHHARGQVLTFSNGELIDLGEYGSGGSLDYYEGKGIIYDYDAGMGNIWGGYYKKSGSKVVTLDEFDGHYGYDPEADMATCTISINGEEATEEELNALGDSYSSKYGETVNAGRDYELTYNNIETYCK